MISVLKSPDKTLNKTFNADGTKTSGTNVSNVFIKTFDCDTPKELADIMQQLQHDEIIISGNVTEDTTQTNKLSTVKRSYVNQASTPWYPFDRDYLVHDQPTIDLLQQLDPQFGYVSYLRKSSASNIIIDDVKQAPYREKVWVQFKSGSTFEQIQDYVTKLRKKAFILGLANIILSPNEDSAAIQDESVFDKSCFRPEALHFEAVPVINNPEITHNTYYYPHNGEQLTIDPQALNFTPIDDTLYYRKMKELKQRIKPLHDKRKAQVKRLRPEQDHDSLDAGFISDDTTLITIDGDEHPVGKILSKLMAGTDISEYLNAEYTDPLDPSYHDATQKAKLYINEDNTLILHSFAHGSHHYRCSMTLTLLPEVLVMLKCRVENETAKERGKMNISDKRETLDVIKRILPLFYIHNRMDLDIVSDTLKQVASKSIIAKLLNEGAFNPTKNMDMTEHPLFEYYYLEEGAGRIITLDSKHGLVGQTVNSMRDSLKSYGSDEDLVEMWLEWSDCKKAYTFGLYENDEHKVVNLWAGFESTEIGKLVTLEDIEPFIYLLKLATGDDKDALAYFMNWLSDLVQNPLREGSRPAIVLQSEAHGTGKGTIFHFVASFFNSFNTILDSKLNSLVGKHNKQLMSTVLFGLDEVVATAEYKPHQVTDILKNIITEPTITVEPKGIDAKQVPNKLHLMVMTNSKFTHSESNGRRFTTFHMSSKHQQDHEYFKGLRDWWNKKDGKNLVFTYLKQQLVDDEQAQTNFKGASTLAASVANIYGFKGREKWLMFFLLDMVKDEQHFTADELHISYTTAYETFTGSASGGLGKRDITSFLKKAFENSPALSYKSNKYIIRRDIMRDKFAQNFLGAINFDWNSISEFSEEEIEFEHKETTIKGIS